MLKVLIADDNSQFVDAIRRIVESDKELQITGIAVNGYEAVQLCVEKKPDIVLMDIKMPGMDGIDATKQIKQYDANIKVLILTTFCENELITRAINSNCDGYILKEINDLEKFISTIKNTCKGLKVMDDEAFHKLVRTYKDMQINCAGSSFSIDEFNLTKREVDIIRLITQGKKNSEIATELFTTEGVVKNMITKVLEKLGLRNCKELAVWGARHNA